MSAKTWHRSVHNRNYIFTGIHVDNAFDILSYNSVALGGQMWYPTPSGLKVC